MSFWNTFVGEVIHKSTFGIVGQGNSEGSQATSVSQVPEARLLDFDYRASHIF